MKSFIKGSKGIGLIEILITMGVLAVGILGIAGLNSVITRQSQDNKAEAEALAIAQSRIEDMLNYTNEATSETVFDTLFLEATDTNSDEITRVGTVFTRTETIVDNANDKDIDVKVAWINASGVDQEVHLNTTVSYIPPRGAGDPARGSTPSTLNAPTGRAKLGEGTIPDDPSDLEITTNNDLTREYIENMDRKLADTDGNVVLTLEDACQTETDCFEFVRIKGTVYLNIATTNANQRPPIGNILLLASDAAYCSRYYEDSSGVTHNVTADTTSVETIGTTYQLFHYTCYLGGGWHGNIGLLFAGNNGNNTNSGHRACVGDPTPDAEPWRTARVAVRRAYRGMMYKKVGQGKEQILNDDSQLVDRVYTQGIMDGAVLGETVGHDFVVGPIAAPTVDVDDNDCDTNFAMTAAGSAVNGVPGDRFEQMPRDFFCLNEGYLNTYESIYAPFEGPIDGCPYDPTNPPASKHIITGTVTFTGAQGSANQTLVDGIEVNTSDGLETCVIDPFVYSATSYTAQYRCGVYDWGTQANPIGWTGYIETTYDYAGMSCTPSTITYTTGVTGNDNSGNDFTNCAPGSYLYISGAVTQHPNNRQLTSVTLDSVACTLTNQGLNYSCKSPQFTGNWTGTHTMILTANGGRLCPNSTASRTFTYSNPAAASITQNVWISANANGCTGAP